MQRPARAVKRAGPAKLILVALGLVSLIAVALGGVYVLWLTSPLTVSGVAPVAPALSPAGEAFGASAPGGPHLSLYHLDPDNSQASYIVEERMLAGGSDTAVKRVGTTHAVAGDLLLNYDNVSASRIGDIVVDISQLASGEQMRDNALRRQWLESLKFPLATFRTTRIDGCREPVHEGQLFECQLFGELTIHGTMQVASWEMGAQLRDAKLTGSATTHVRMSAFGIELPQILGTLKVQDEMDLKLDFIATLDESSPTP